MVLGAAAALSDQGDGFTIGCSHGSITLPVEATEAVEALRVADQRMYANKHAGRTSAGRQSKDVLLRALAERHPELGSHAETVAIAAATAEALGLPPDEVEHVRHASELHDVGKVAIPDAILGKPGPLTEEEWTFVRRHPVIGERIILAAPALRRVATLVRASHERWDGAGYPDALAGDGIALGARIVAVADAFAAMIAGRPYRAARTAEEALEELRRHAGTQFDPDVVEAWCAAHARRVVHATHASSAPGPAARVRLPHGRRCRDAQAHPALRPPRGGGRAARALRGLGDAGPVRRHPGGARRGAHRRRRVRRLAHGRGGDDRARRGEIPPARAVQRRRQDRRRRRAVLGACAARTAACSTTSSPIGSRRPAS